MVGKLCPNSVGGSDLKKKKKKKNYLPATLDDFWGLKFYATLDYIAPPQRSGKTLFCNFTSTVSIIKLGLVIEELIDYPCVKITF